MLNKRLYVPRTGEVVYHYCSPESFLAICKSKKLRFSDIFSMNDGTEMHWGYSIWEKAATKAMPTVGKSFLNEIDKKFGVAGFKTLPIIACFSRNRNSLSQWRAYAQDGQGYSIGFKAESLSKMAATMLDVEYDEEAQIAEVCEAIAELHRVYLHANEDPGAYAFRDGCFYLGFQLASLKNPGFAEEKEIRSVHLLGFEESNESLRLVDNGGTAFGANSDGESVNFYMRNGVPVSYVDLDFSNRGKEAAIHEVLIGPKNVALPSGVAIFLETLNIQNVKVCRSNTPYR